VAPPAFGLTGHLHRSLCQIGVFGEAGEGLQPTTMLEQYFQRLRLIAQPVQVFFAPRTPVCPRDVEQDGQRLAAQLGTEPEFVAARHAGDGTLDVKRQVAGGAKDRQIGIVAVADRDRLICGFGRAVV
jgi:hypothetical protein